MQNYITDALDNNKNMSKELRHNILLPKTEDVLHDFSSVQLNANFSSVPGENGTAFKPVSLDDVRAAVKHFTTQTSGKDGIPQNVVAKVVPVICPHLVELFNASFTCSIFPAS